MKLEDVCKVFTDGDWIESKDQSDNGIRLIQTGNIGEGVYLEKSERAKYVSQDTFDALKCTEIYSGDVLVSRLPEPVGRACIIPPKSERMITAVDCTICRPNEEIVLKEYLCYFMQSDVYYNRLLNNVTGTTRKRISRKNLGNVEINVPDIDTQRAIIAKLDIISNIIDERKRELEQLDVLIKARFVELFGRPEDKKYPSVRLGDYAKLQGGYAFKSKDFVDEGVPLVQIGNVNKDYLDWDVINAVPEEYIDKYSEFALSKDDLVMAMTRPIIKSLGSVKIAKVAEDDLPCLLNQRVGRFQIKDKIHPVFLEILCKTDDFKDYVERMSGNSLQPNISSKQVEDYIIILPPIELQEIFAEFVKQVDKSKVA